MSIVFSADGLTSMEKLLLLAYADRADHNGDSRLSDEWLARDCSTDLGTAKQVKAQLIGRALLQPAPDVITYTGPDPNLIRINLPLLASMARKQETPDDFIHAITFDEVPPGTPTLDRKSVVYAVGDGRNSTVKIGTTGNLASRLKGLQTGSPHELRVLCTFRGGAELEAHLHRRFAKRRVQGEWFDFDGDDAVALITQAARSFEVAR